MGVDVSEHQVNVDWQAVKRFRSGVRHHPGGYWGYEIGELYADTEAQIHVRRASPGLKIGRLLLSLSGPERRGSRRRSSLLHVGAAKATGSIDMPGGLRLGITFSPARDGKYRQDRP